MKKYHLYKITSPSGRVYIGMTSNIIRRYNDYKHKRCKTQPLIYKSINKYSFEKHIFEILLSNLDKSSCIEAEIAHIKKYKELKISLNITDGGEGVLGVFGVNNKHSKKIVQLTKENTIIKVWDSISDAGRHFGSQGVISKNMRKLKMVYKSYWNYYYNYMKGERLDYKGILKSRTRQIIQFDKKGNIIKEYWSIKEAIEETGLNKSTIHKSLNNKVKSRKYDFKYKNN